MISKSQHGHAVVVGAGPNGLAAAVALARLGRRVDVYESAATAGGGSRTEELIEPDHWHDVCSAAHPLGAASPFFAQLPLADYGLEWITPDVAVSHPLDAGRAAGITRSIDETGDLLGSDGAAYRALVEPLLANFDTIVPRVLAPLQAGWRSPVRMARFGAVAVRSTAALADKLVTEDGKALLAGLGAHSIARLDAAATAGVAVLLAAAGHVVGWPIVRGGSQAIADALAGYLQELGGTIHCEHAIESLERFDPDTPIFLDTAPGAAVRIGGSRLDAGPARRLSRWRHGPGSHKVDWILGKPIPWADPLSGRSATVHVGGTFAEIAASEAAATAGEAPTQPFVLVTQPSLFDPRRAPAGRHIAWGYCHVPANWDGDATAAIEDQIERFAPGFRASIVARHVTTARGFASYNANYVGGDIGGGEMSLRRLLVGMPPRRNPYRIGRRLYLCSASTPPGAGVHGMCGYNAVEYARSELES